MKLGKKKDEDNREYIVFHNVQHYGTSSIPRNQFLLIPGTRSPCYSRDIISIDRVAAIPRILGIRLKRNYLQFRKQFQFRNRSESPGISTDSGIPRTASNSEIARHFQEFLPIPEFRVMPSELNSRNSVELDQCRLVLLY